MKSKAKQKTFINNMITYAIVVVAYIVVQILMGTGHMSSLMKGLLVPFCIYVIMAVSLNLTVGILGELSLGHAGFMCVGAFAGALFSKCMKGSMNPTVSLIIAVIIGAVVAAVFGILIGIPVLRLKGDYLAIVTLAFGEIIKNIINAVYLGRDGSGFHISLKDSMSLNMDADGEVLIKGAQGITGTRCNNQKIQQRFRADGFRLCDGQQRFSAAQSRDFLPMLLCGTKSAVYAGADLRQNRHHIVKFLCQSLQFRKHRRKGAK